MILTAMQRVMDVLLGIVCSYLGKEENVANTRDRMFDQGRAETKSRLSGMKAAVLLNNSADPTIHPGTSFDDLLFLFSSFFSSIPFDAASTPVDPGAEDILSASNRE